jgi:hypothetical protein
MASIVLFATFHFFTCCHEIDVRLLTSSFNIFTNVSLTGDLIFGDTIIDASLKLICCACNPEEKTTDNVKSKIIIFIIWILRMITPLLS